MSLKTLLLATLGTSASAITCYVGTATSEGSVSGANLDCSVTSGNEYDRCMTISVTSNTSFTCGTQETCSVSVDNAVVSCCETDLCNIGSTTQYASINYFNEPSAAPTSVKGWVKVETSVVDLTLEASLWGLDPDTTGGLHIHYGTSCESEMSIKGDAPTDANKGHYYDPSQAISDPWSSVNWVADSAGKGTASVTITPSELGAAPSTARDRVVVVHNPEGKKIGCGVLSDSIVQRASIAYFPEPSAAPMDIGGVVTVTATQDLIEVSATLTGLEDGTEGGLHIHYGRSCASETSVKGDAPADASKGHFYRDASSLPDPWATTKWQAVSATTATASFTISRAALGVDHTVDALDRVLIVHNPEGKKIGCGLLSFAAEQIGQISYFNEPSASPTTVNGFVTAAASHNDLTLSWWLMGLDTSTTGGLHIHYGRSCESEVSVKGDAPDGANKGHYYIPEDAAVANATQDPWGPVTWSSDGDGKAVGSVTISKDDLRVSDTALAFDRAVIVHNTDGKKVGCGVLSVSISQTAEISYFSAPSASPSTVAGTAVAVVTPTYLQLMSQLEGLEPSVSGGIHIHYGKTCDSEESVKGDAPATANKGHFYVPRDLAVDAPEDDPWGATYFSNKFSPNAVWMSDADGNAKTSVTISSSELNTKPWTAFDRATIVHNSEGLKIGCGVLNTCATCPTEAPVCDGLCQNCQISSGSCLTCPEATCQDSFDAAVNSMLSMCALLVGISCFLL